MTQSTTGAYGIQLWTVQTPSGGELNLQTDVEADWYDSRRDRYLTDNAFQNVSDLQDLDRLLQLEVMTYRWGLWVSQGFDYLHSRVDESALTSKIKEYSVETRLLKASLGIDKATRDKVKGESLADYVADLLHRAKEFGYFRNDQYSKAVTKMWELRSLVMTLDRCDSEERALLDLSEESIIAWVRENVMAEWDDMSEAFRKDQAMWIRRM